MNRYEPPAPPAPPDAPADSRITPMMEQYVEIRAANPDCLLFYRMGDFYELFFDDAAIASRALGIALTKRGKHQGADIPMCGVPVHAADEYLQRLIAQGHRVAVCEQTEDPAEARRRGNKSVVRRAVTRLVTPGTLTEDSLLDPGRGNFLAALVAPPGANNVAVAWADISTGEFRLAETGRADLPALLARIEPRELLHAERADLAALREVGGEGAAALTPLPPAFFDPASAGARLASFFGVATMEAFGAFGPAELAAGAALVAYAEKTQIAARPRLEPPKRVADDETMRIDAATRANLELFRTLTGGQGGRADNRGSLFAAIDRTITAAGSRLLAERLASPLRDPGKIAARLDQVARLADDPAMRGKLRENLKAAPDMLRALSRLALARGGPRDLGSICAGLEAAAEAAAALANGESAPFTDCLAGLRLVAPKNVAGWRAALRDELPQNRRDGGFVRPGFCAELDAAASLRDDTRRVVAALQATYAEATGIRGLKIKHNNMLGYFVEMNARDGERLAARPIPESALIRERSHDLPGSNPPEGGFIPAENPKTVPVFIHRQTMANAMRFSTAELADLERRIAEAADTALAREQAIFDELCEKILAEAEPIRAAAQALAILDVSAALAELATDCNYVRPTVDASLAFTIVAGRHPVVEQSLRRDGKSFVGNDSDLGPASSGALPASPSRGGAGGGAAPTPEGKIYLLTGPNMAGKSTFLRQNALIAILAQAGSFVPAKAAHIGIVDALFSRVGAADDLARGRSTFMVEMVETAAILNQAGPRALVILDEIGRGTATFDGLSIAWAVIEHLHAENCCRALFATHYHELTALAARLPRLVNVTMSVKEWKGDVVFLHEVVAGAADHSYGIHVAKLAGLPPAVISRARAVLALLEKGERARPVAIVDDLPLFAAAPPSLRGEGGGAAPPPDPVAEALAAIDPDHLTPKEALDALYRLKALSSGGDS